jgi:hypothetical protein
MSEDKAEYKVQSWKVATPATDAGDYSASLPAGDCIDGMYYLSLYCRSINPAHTDNRMQFPDEYVGVTRGDCIKEARQIGWKFDFATRSAYCPLCVKQGLHKKTNGQ